MSEFRSNPPEARPLMATARSFGNYDLAGALADLIDNSIKAKSSIIKITTDFNHGHPSVRIRDDGYGMTEQELFRAMRPASTDPDEQRSPDDLGRFGWGMKSASFSQCKKLIVITSNSESLSGAFWDLDLIDDWSMGVLDQSECESLLSEPFAENTGTELIWQKCDRLSEDGALTEDSFNELIVHTSNKLALIYHRYLASSGVDQLKIFFNGIEIEALDPFHSSHNATQPSHPEVVILNTGQKITFQAYVLPHYSKLNKDEYERLGGEEGYVKNQGFYVYRNKRLIIHGTWFRLAKHGELSKLVRVMVDIPNSLDSMWKITVDKSDAQLPSALKSRLKDLIEHFKLPSTKVIRSKGGRIDRPGINSIWKRFSRNNQIRFYLNHDYPIVRDFISGLSDEDKKSFQVISQLIEQGLPIDAIISDISTNPLDVNQSPSGREDFERLLQATIPGMLLTFKGDVPSLVQNLKSTEPFSSNIAVVEEYLAQIGIL